MTTQIPSLIGIDAAGLTFDGKRFPFALASEPVTVEASEHDGARVTVTLLADSVHIDPLLTVETDGDVTLVSEPEVAR